MALLEQDCLGRDHMHQRARPWPPGISAEVEVSSPAPRFATGQNQPPRGRAVFMRCLVVTTVGIEAPGSDKHLALTSACT